MLAWLVVLLVSGAGVFAGLNTMYGSVVGRIRELATLQTVGFARRAMLVSLIQEGVILAAAASLTATLAALLFINQASVRFTMGAFALRIDDVGRADRLRGRAFAWGIRRDTASNSRVADARSSMGYRAT